MHRQMLQTRRAGMKKVQFGENLLYVMYPDNVTYEHIGEISIS